MYRLHTVRENLAFDQTLKVGFIVVNMKGGGILSMYHEPALSTAFSHIFSYPSSSACSKKPLHSKPRKVSIPDLVLDFQDRKKNDALSWNMDNPHIGLSRCHFQLGLFPTAYEVMVLLSFRAMAGSYEHRPIGPF